MSPYIVIIDLPLLVALLQSSTIWVSSLWSMPMPPSASTSGASLPTSKTTRIKSSGLWSVLHSLMDANIHIYVRETFFRSLNLHPGNPVTVRPGHTLYVKSASLTSEAKNPNPNRPEATEFYITYHTSISKNPSRALLATFRVWHVCRLLSLFAKFPGLTDILILSQSNLN